MLVSFKHLRLIVFARTFDMTGVTTVAGTAVFTNAGVFAHTGTGTGAVTDALSTAELSSPAQGARLPSAAGSPTPA
jgi:hypothetical protein